MALCYPCSLYLFYAALLFCYHLHVSLTLQLILTNFVHMYRINTHCLTFTFAVLLGCLQLYFIYYPTSFAAAYFLEMSYLATPCTCLPIHWALSWQVYSTTRPTWLPLQCPANWSSHDVFLCPF